MKLKRGRLRLIVITEVLREVVKCRLRIASDV